MSLCHLAVLPALTVLMLAVPATAQPEAPLPEDPVEARKFVHGLLDRRKQLREQATHGDKAAEKQLEAVEEKTKTLIERFLTPEGELSQRHYLALLVGLIEVHEGQTAARVAEAGLRRYPDDPLLHEAAAQGWFMASCDRGAGIRRTRHYCRQARAHYQKVLDLKPDHARSVGALFAIQMTLGCYDEAQRLWEKTRREKDDKDVAGTVGLLEEIGAVAMIPGMLLMGQKRYAEAVEAFQSQACRENDPFFSAVLSLRCQALAGNKSLAYEIAGKLPTRGLNGRLALWARADMLAWFGEQRQAVSLLERHPVERLPSENKSGFRLAQQTHAGLIRLASMTSDTWTETRLVLPNKNLLDHNLLYMGADENGKFVQVNLNDSPVGMGLLMLGCPRSVKTGPNTILAALCAWDAQTYAVKSEAEKFILEHMSKDDVGIEDADWIRSREGLADILDYLDTRLLSEDFVGALIGYRAAREMRAKLKAK